MSGPSTDGDTFDLPCTVLEVGPARKSEKGFRFRELVVTTGNPRFPQTIPATLAGPRVDIAGDLKPGEPIVLTFSLRGREHNGRRYVSVDAWRIQRYDAAGCLYTAAPPDPAQPELPFGPPAAPTAAAAPYDATHHYRPGERAIIQGRVYEYSDAPDRAPWTLVPESTPAGTVVDDQLPF